MSPAILAQRYREYVNPNDEPFLPIHPTYPYNPKLVKRGSDKEIVALLKPELYAPRPDARDSYTASYAGNPKDSFFSGYGSYPRSYGNPYSPYSSYFGNSPYGGFMNPYTAEPYAGNPYPSTSGHQGSSSYPGYYQQTPYFYPDYYNQPFPYSLTPPDHSGPPPPAGPPRNEYPESNRDHSAKFEKSKSGKSKSKENSSGVHGGETNQNGSGNQYVDGNNLISQNPKDLVTQTTVFRNSNPYNKLEQIVDLNLKNVPIPHTTYKVISVGGQPVGPNYPLPSSYAKAQLIEQTAAIQNFAKSMGHAFSNQGSGAQAFQSVSSYLPYVTTVGQGQSSSAKPGDEEKFYSADKNPAGKIQDGEYPSDYSLAVPLKSNEAHVYGSDERDLPSQESSTPFLPGNRENNDEAEYQTGQADKSLESFEQSPPKAPSKYQSLPYAQKPGTIVTFERSQSTYISPEKIRPPLEEDAAEPSSPQSYDQSPLSQSSSYRPGQSYRSGAASYHGQNLRHGTPIAFSYHQTNVQPFSQGSQPRVKTNLEDVNFGAKQGNKG